MMVRILVVLALWLATAGLAAAERPQPIPPGAALAGAFRQERVLGGLDRPLISDGRFLVLPGRGLIWRSERPLASITVITPRGLSQIVDSKETMRLSADRLPALSRLYVVLNAALAGDFQSLEQDFNIRHGARDGGWESVLEPRRGDSSDMPFTRIVLRGGAHVEEVEIEKSGGDRDRIRFSNQTVGQGAVDPADLDLLARAGG